MTTNRHIIEVSGLPVEVVRKDIKNLHLAVYPPDGRVRIAVPLRLDDEAARLAVIGRLGWIRHQQAAFGRQERQSEREMVTGESHYVQGRRYRLSVIVHGGPTLLRLRNNRVLELHVPDAADAKKRRALLDQWYRIRLRDQLAELLARWQPVTGIEVRECRIKRMKTRWGTCNVEDRRIWLNLELAKKPTPCVEYVLVHELVHLLERHHNERFEAHMNRLMPQWRLYRDELNQSPLAHEDWHY